MVMIMIVGMIMGCCMTAPMLRFLVVIVVAAARHGGTPYFVVCFVFNTL